MRIVKLLVLIGLAALLAAPALALINENGTGNQPVPVASATEILPPNTARQHWAVECTANVLVMEGGPGGVAPSPEPTAAPTPGGVGFLFNANSLYTEQSLPQGTAGASQRLDGAAAAGASAPLCYTWTE